MKNQTIIFCDGASKGNPGPGGWGAIISLPSGKVHELGAGEKHTTNNKMELTAAINALLSLGSLASKSEEIVLNTDSSYVINGITGWVYGWQKNNWKNSKKEPVLNRDLWEELIKAASSKKIKWNYVGGHVGVAGNERADFIAASYADNESPKLFNGKISDYKINLSDTSANIEKKKKKTKSRVKAYSYVSLVGGIVKVHKTWAECEKRVKGVKGNVKFKKSESTEDENKIIKEWSHLR